MKNTLFIITLILLLFPSVASAQNKDAPIEISADNTLEWHRDKQQYIATGNAVAIQNETKIKADTLTAHYISSPQKDTEITKIIAEGHVIITTKDTIVTGDKAVYLIKDEQATLTGDTLKLTNDKMTVEASDSFEYWTQAQKFKAKGHTKIVDQDRILTADEVTAWFMDKEGEQILKEANAIGNVVMITQSDTASGDTGHYDGLKEIITLEDNVKIVRDKNILNGTRAIVNLKTGISQLFGDKTGGRVTGTFFPKKKD